MRRKKPRLHRLIYVATGVAAALGLVAALLARWLLVDLPAPDQLYEHTATSSTHIYDRNGRLLYEILDPHGGAHTPVSLDEIPPACRDATIATEDASFYANPGVDAWAIVRALWINVRGGEILSGGSTITQQLARNLLLSPQERTQVTLRRKMRESILAWRLARTYTKDEILALYLNESNYGNLAYGIEAAAQTYFAKSATELDLAECTLLAGLPQAPAYYNPLENPQAAQERQSTVLRLMVKHGYLDQPEAELAADENLQFASAPFPIEAPHAVMRVRDQLERTFGLEALYTQGLRVYTTIDLDAQNAARRIMRYRLGQLAEGNGGQPARNVNNAAVVALDPHTGQVVALVGSPDYFAPRIDGAVNAAVTRRQPGSSIKPITYAAAFDPARPRPLTPATVMVDTRTVFTTREGEPYIPRNYDRTWHGPVRLRQALACSYNLVSVKVLNEVGLDAMTRLARSMGITTLDDAERFGLALTLGGGEVRLLELTAAYGAFANGGLRVEPTLITRVEDEQGNRLKAWETAPGPRVLDERVAYLITDILSDNFARSAAFGEGSALRLSRPAAAKTGTTSDWRDNWTVGYTPDLVVGVWAGNADNQPMEHVSGVTGAAPIWHDVMETLLLGRPERAFAQPPGLVEREICADSGLLPAAEPTATEAGASGRRVARCPRTVTERFIAGTQPTRTDDWHWIYAIDTRNGLLASSGCPPEVVAHRRYTVYPSEAQDWVGWREIERPPERFSPLCPGERRVVAPSTPPAVESPLMMTRPDHGGTYQLSPEMPAEAQKILVAARPAESVAIQEITLLADGEPLATLTGPPYQTLWVLEPGRHTFTSVGVDSSGGAIEGNSVIIEVVNAGE